MESKSQPTHHGPGNTALAYDPCHLTSLSAELLVYIISYLRLEDITACEQSCTHLFNVVKDSLLLQYLKEAGASGVRGTFGSQMALPERLEKLRLWRKGWEEFNVSKSTPVTKLQLVDAGWVEEIDLSLSGGHFFGTRPFSEDHGYMHVDLSSLPDSPSHAAIFPAKSLPTSVEFPPIVSTTAEEKDLLVVISYLSSDDGSQHGLGLSPWQLQLHILSLAHGKEHPLAACPRVHISVPPQRGVGAGVFGDYVVVVASSLHDDDSEEIYLVSWRTGSVHILRSSPAGTYFPQFSQVTADVLVLVQRQGSALELCKLDTGESPSLVTLCALGLPELQPRSFYKSVVCQGDRIVSECPPRKSSLPFSSDPKDGVLFFSVVVRRHSPNLAKHRSVRVAFWVLRRSLRGQAIHATGRRCPWEGWGPPATRWVLSPASSPIREAKGHVAGSRFVYLGMGLQGDAERIIVRDFYPERVNRALAEGHAATSRAGGRFKVVTEPSTIDQGYYFRAPVVSELKFCETWSESSHGYSDVLMDDERIVGVLAGGGEVALSVHKVTPVADCTD
ncbi:hypothetical protein BC834DRAFT_99874 [Gloeopeniophorella convolvens]|nr:hypothetical protein BC834DRAFT_99874 [Gloeopeniophorella convolvens]